MNDRVQNPRAWRKRRGGDVTNVLVNVGDTIAREQPVLELETDKATIEVPSSVAGVVKEIRVKKGDKVKVGAVVLTVDAPASGNGGGAAAATAAAASPRRRRPLRLPEPPRSRRRPTPAAGASSDSRAGRADAGAADARAAPRAAAPRPRSRESRWPCGAGVAGRATSRARDWRQHQRRRRHRTQRTHHAGRRQGTRAADSEQRRLGGRRAGRQRGAPGAAAARLLEVRRGRSPGVDQHPPRDGRASQLRLEHDSARHAVRQGRRDARSKRCASGTRSRSRRPAAI